MEKETIDRLKTEYDAELARIIEEAAAAGQKWCKDASLLEILEVIEMFAFDEDGNGNIDAVLRLDTINDDLLEDVPKYFQAYFVHYFVGAIIDFHEEFERISGRGYGLAIGG